jgi:hypothetical protein
VKRPQADSLAAGHGCVRTLRHVYQAGPAAFIGPCDQTTHSCPCPFSSASVTATIGRPSLVKQAAGRRRYYRHR